MNSNCGEDADNFKCLRESSGLREMNRDELPSAEAVQKFLNGFCEEEEIENSVKRERYRAPGKW